MHVFGRYYTVRKKMQPPCKATNKRGYRGNLIGLMVVGYGGVIQVLS